MLDLQLSRWLQAEIATPCPTPPAERTRISRSRQTSSRSGFVSDEVEKSPGLLPRGEQLSVVATRPVVLTLRVTAQTSGSVPYDRRPQYGGLVMTE